MAKKARRTTHRSGSGKKLYAKRKADGTFSDIQTYKRAHAADLRTKSAAETKKAGKKSAKKTVKKAPRKVAKKVVKKAVKKTTKKVTKKAKKK
jgi:hypothetical protein